MTVSHEGSMVERVRDAICVVADRHVAAVGSGLAEQMARAAIEAMRNPSPQLLGLAADRAVATRGGGATWPYCFREGYRAMIDAALSPSPAPEEVK